MMDKEKREVSDYDDFYVAARDEAKEQISTAEDVINQIRQYLRTKAIIG